MNNSDRLRELRLNSGLTLDEAGKMIGATKQTLYKYENGIVKNIPSDKIEQLARIYNISPSYIMGWDESNDLSVHEIKIAQSYLNAKQSEKTAIIALVEAIDKLLKLD